MDISQKKSSKVSATPIEQCNSSTLKDIYATYKDKIDIISLDCFDTILWRKVAKPTDVFFELQNHEIFKQFSITASLRTKLEQIARNRNYVKYGSHEVTLSQIYMASDQHFNEEQIKQLVEAELELEATICFAYQPVVELIIQAGRDNKQVIIQSDIYFTKAQLEYLLLRNLPEEAFDYISLIHVSNEHQVGKTNGLHEETLKVCDIHPERVLHIGDNLHADFFGAKRHGLHAIHLVQYSNEILTQQRMRDFGLSLTDTSVRSEMPLYTPYRHLLSQHTEFENEPHHLLGYATLGPIYFNFALYLHREVIKLRHNYPDIKILFLLRDGYLPHQIFSRIFPEENAQQVRISRFASFAASFRTEDDIQRYVASVIENARYDAILNQLLVSPSKAKKIISAVKKSKEPKAHFCKLVLQKDTMAEIISASQQYCQRLVKYLQLEADVQNGDKVLFVDLGYSATTQKQLTTVFEDEHNITIFGRYLIALPTTGWQTHKGGLLDMSNTDERLLETLVAYVALLEQLSTTTDKSVVDFDEEGHPIYGESSINQDQYVKLMQIQSQCSLYANDVLKDDQLYKELQNEQYWCQTTLAELIRLLYFPAKQELDYLQCFKFDLNLGTNDVYELFDEQKGLDALRTRGLFFMERASKNMRTNYPAELRANGIELLSLLLAQHRYGFEFNSSDISFRELPVSVYILKENGHVVHTVAARPTYDGYFSAIIPLGKGEFITAANFGKHYRWLQIYASEIIVANKLYQDDESLFTRNAMEDSVFDQAAVHGESLIECKSEDGMLLLQQQQLDENSVWRVVFRPIEMK